MSDTTPTPSRREQHAYLVRKFHSGIEDAAGALLHIHHYRTYLDDYATFEEFCEHDLKISRRHAYRLLEFAGFVEEIVAKNVTPGSHPQLPPPESERQYRALKLVQPEIRQLAWQEVVETAPDGKVTVEHVERVAAGFVRSAAVHPDKPTARFSQPAETERLRARVVELEAALKEVLAAEEAARTNRHDGGVIQRWRLALSHLRALLTKPHHTADAGNVMPRYDA